MGGWRYSLAAVVRAIWGTDIVATSGKATQSVRRIQHIVDSVTFTAAGFGSVDIPGTLFDVDRSAIAGVPSFDDTSANIASTVQYRIDGGTAVAVVVPAFASLTRTVYITIVEYW